MQNVEQLSLVLMQALHLHVKNGIRVNGNSVVFLDIFCKAHLVPALDFHKFLLCRGVACILCNTVYHRKVHNPVLTDFLRHPVSKKRVSVKQESSLRNTVCLVVELARIHLIEIFQLLVLENLRVQLRNTVYAVACNNCQMRHLNLTVRNNRHLFDFVSRFRISVHDIEEESAVNLLHNLVNSREQPLEQVYRPFFKRLCHNGMVCVCTGLCRNLPCLVPLKTVIIKQDSHQLSDCHCRMGVIELECHLFIKTMDIVMLGHIFLNRSLHGCRDKEVLLL